MLIFFQVLTFYYYHTQGRDFQIIKKLIFTFLLIILSKEIPVQLPLFFFGLGMHHSGYKRGDQLYSKIHVFS